MLIFKNVEKFLQNKEIWECFAKKRTLSRQGEKIHKKVTISMRNPVLSLILAILGKNTAPGSQNP
jgi:hypothetical protein